MLNRKPRQIRHADGSSRSFQEHLKALAGRGVLDRKTRELLLVALACALQCPYCTELHVKEALDAGASRDEVCEALLLAALEGAGTHTVWYEDIQAGYSGEG
jgi:AhpD family alkylhydroperoxidase